MEGTLRCTLGTQAQYSHSLADHTRYIQQSTCTHIKHFHNTQQQNNNHTQTYCELFHQTIHKHATHKTNKSICRATPKHIMEKSIIPYITANVSNTVRTITVALDMRIAFDTINIHTFIRKLLQTNMPGTIIKFIANYTRGRIANTT